MRAQLQLCGQFRHATSNSTNCLLSTTESAGNRWDHLFSKPGSVTAITENLRLLGKAKALSDGKILHTYIRTRRLDLYTFVGNCLIEMYANCGSLQDAIDAFTHLPNPNVYSWNMLIKAYGQNGSVRHAFNVFASMPLKDSVSWNAMISTFSQHGHGRHALDLYNKMREERFVPNNITFLSALDACAGIADLQEGQDIHAFIVGIGCDQDDVLIGTALVNMYGKCNSLHEAICVFNKLRNRDVIAWNAMISVFSQMNISKGAFHFFHRMLADGLTPNAVSFISVLEACLLEEGLIVHAFVLESFLDKDIEVCTALFTMYGNHGRLHDAMHVFERMSCRTTVSWNAMI
eukprot:c17950_g1_i1 orf=3-1040(-)